jgi:tRNA(Ile)-lysidine synthase
MRLRRIEPALRRAFRGPCATPHGGLVLVAVSGGPDSTALLLGLHRLAPELGIRVGAAHLHHGLRGAEAEGDLEFVRALCARLGVPLEWARWDTRALMSRRGWSGQEGLRRLRRAFLKGVARRTAAEAIATGHTADDQVETLLLRLARGTGLAGLGGIAPRRGLWIRPLLAIPRHHVIADLRATGQTWREDSSNSDLSYARNRIRHRAIPSWLGEEDAASRARLALRVTRMLREVRQARRILESRATKALVDGAPPRAGERTLAVEPLAVLPDVLLRLALRRAWRSLRAPRGLTGPMLDNLVALIRRNRPGRARLSGGWFAERERGTIRIGSPSEGIEPVDPLELPRRRLRVPGRTVLGGLELRASWVNGARARHELIRSCTGECFAAAHIQGELELRLAASDEWFVPYGRLRPRRLGDFLKKERIPATGRADRLVLADQRGILWVVGLRRSARAPVTPGTRKALWVRAGS